MRVARPWIQLGRWLLAVIFGCIVVSVFAANGPIQPGESIPDFTLTAVRGEGFTLRADAPQPALIAFLQTVPDTADTPSRSQVALLQSMYHQYSRRGLRVAIVDATALASGHKPDRGSLINASYDWNLQIPLLEDESGRVAQMLGVTHAPAVILVDAHGIVANVWLGRVAPGELATAIEKVLGGGPLAPGSTPQRAK
jgi:peroxiredoxin